MRVTIEPRDPLAPLLARAVDLRPALERYIAFRRQQIKEEWETASWRPMSGGLRPWQPVGAFGNRPAPSSPLRRTGALLRAWLGGPGSITRIGDTEAVFGVSGSRFPHAAVHRGGAGKVTAALSRVPERIGITPAMRTFVGLNFGVWFKRSKRFIEIPRRPHATDNPEAATARAAFLSEHIRGVAQGAA